MNGELRLYVDQFGAHYYARTVRDLMKTLDCRHATRMFVDKRDGSTVHVGYVIRGHWLTAYVPYAKVVRA